MRMMLTNQSIVDGAACLVATILLVQPQNWIPGINILDDIICHVWDGQFVYWYMVLVSGMFTGIIQAQNHRMYENV